MTLTALHRLLAICSLMAFLPGSSVQAATVSQAAGPAKKKPPVTGQRPGVPESTFNRLKAQAEAARDTDQIPEAIALYMRLIQLRPDWAEGWWHVGAMRYDRDEFQEAEKSFAKYLVLEPNNGQAWGMIGLCEYRNKKSASSLQHLAKARKLGLGGNVELGRVVRYHEALLLIRGLQFEAGLSLLQQFALEHLESPPVIEAMGLAVLRIPEPIEELKPEDNEMARSFGKAAWLAYEHKRQESLQLYEQLEARYRGKPNAAYAVGTALAGQQESERAVTFFKKELERDPQHVAAMLQAAFQDITARNFPEALEFAQKAMGLDPGNFACYYIQGRVYLYMDDLPHAITMLEKAGSLAADSFPVFYTLAQAYQRANRPEDAARVRAIYERLEENENKKKEVTP